MFKTRFVFQSPPSDIEKNTRFIGTVLRETDQAPESFTMSVHDDIGVTTVIYLTPTTAESDLIIPPMKRIFPNVQFERTHCLDVDLLASSALAGANGRALRRVLTREVRCLTERGIGSKGVLEYLQECEEIVAEIRLSVQSQRAHL